MIPQFQKPFVFLRTLPVFPEPFLPFLYHLLLIGGTFIFRYGLSVSITHSQNMYSAVRPEYCVVWCLVPVRVRSSRSGCTEFYRRSGCWDREVKNEQDDDREPHCLLFF